MCSNPKATLNPQREFCYATMEREAANAAYERLHKTRPFHDGTFTRWAEHQSAAFPYRYSDGVTIGVAETDLRPHDLFTTVESADPYASSTDDLGPDVDPEQGGEGAEEAHQHAVDGPAFGDDDTRNDRP